MTRKLTYEELEQRVMELEGLEAERKWAEEPLRGSEERFRTIFMESAMGIGLADLEARILKANPAFLRMLGFSGEELTGKSFLELTHPDDVEKEGESFRRLIEGMDRSVHLEKRYVRKDGQLVWANLTASLCSEDMGIPQFVIGMVEDITSRKQLEEALREDELRFRSFFEATFEGLVLHDEGVILDANHSYEMMFGYQHSEIIGRSVLDLVAEESRSLVKRSMKADAGKAYQAMGLRKDGTTFHLEVIGKDFQYRGRRVRVVGVRDITERKRAEESIRIERDKLEIVTQSIGAGLAIISKDYRTLWANKVLKQIFGDVEGKVCHSTYNQRNNVCPSCGVREVFEQGTETVVHEQVGRDIEGNTIWSQIIATPLRDKDRNITCALELVVPITERKRAEDELRENEERFRAIFEGSLDAIFLADPKAGIILDANPAAWDLLSLSREEIVGLHYSQVVPPHQRQQAEEAFFGMANGADFRNPREAVILGSDGTEKPCEVMARMIQLDGKPVIYGVFRDITERKLAEEKLRVEELALRDSEARFRSLSTQLLKHQENERGLLAKDIHDSIGQILATIKLRVEELLQQMKGGPEIKPLEDVVPIIQKGIEDVRRMQRSLRPAILDELGLLSTIEWFCEEFEVTCPRTHVEREVNVDEGDVPEPLKIVTFRIVQEAMNNVGKHSGAGLVRLRLGKRDNTLGLVIKDDGQGFDAVEAQRVGPIRAGLGLSSMMERVHFSGGSFAIESAIGQGTTLRASWPLNHFSVP